MDISFGESNTTDWAFPISVGCGIVNALLTKNMGTCLQDHLSLPVGAASTHYFSFIFFHFSPQDLKLRLGIQLQIEFTVF